MASHRPRAQPLLRHRAATGLLLGLIAAILALGAVASTALDGDLTASTGNVTDTVDQTVAGDGNETEAATSTSPTGTQEETTDADASQDANATTDTTTATTEDAASTTDTTEDAASTTDTTEDAASTTDTTEDTDTNTTRSTSTSPDPAEGVEAEGTIQDAEATTTGTMETATGSNGSDPTQDAGTEPTLAETTAEPTETATGSVRDPVTGTSTLDGIENATATVSTNVSNGTTRLDVDGNTSVDLGTSEATINRIEGSLEISPRRELPHPANGSVPTSPAGPGDPFATPALPGTPREDPTAERGTGDPPPAAGGGSLQTALQRGLEHLGREALEHPEVSVPVATTATAMSGLWALRLLRTLGPAGFSAMYSRLSKREVLEHEERSALLSLLREEPGLSVSEIMERRGTAWGVTIYHLERLEDEDVLESRHQGQHRRFYPVDEVPPADRDALGLLREETPSRIVATICENDAPIQSAIADHVGLAPSTVHRHLKRLAEADLVDREKDGRTVRYQPTRKLQGLMRRRSAAGR